MAVGYLSPPEERDEEGQTYKEQIKALLAGGGWKLKSASLTTSWDGLQEIEVEAYRYTHDLDQGAKERFGE